MNGGVINDAFFSLWFWALVYGLPWHLLGTENALQPFLRLSIRRISPFSA